jgi:DNA polymerase III subunit gamma/tau
VIALAPHAPPATSLPSLFAAEVPAAGSTAAAGSLFHSLLQEATDANRRNFAASEIPATAPRSQLASTSIAALAARARSLQQADTEAGDRPKTKSPTKNSAADNAPATTVSLPPQRTNINPVTLNVLPARDSDENGTETPDGFSAAELTAAEMPAIALRAGAEARAHSTPQTAFDAGSRAKTKSAKKDSAAENVPAAIPTPPQWTNTLPVTLAILPARDDRDKNDRENSNGISTTGETSAATKIAEESAQPRSALWIDRRIAPEERSATTPPMPRSAPEKQADPESPLAVTASTADGSLSKIQPAFEARLQPVEPRESPEPAATAVPAASGKPEVSRPSKDNTIEPVEPEAAASGSAPGLTQAAPSSSKHGDGSHHSAQEQPQEPASVAPRLETGAELAQAKFDGSAPAPPVASAPSSSNAANRSDAPATPEPAVPPEPPSGAAPATAHDIKLELNGGGQRVEVRLTDRGGDIQVAVRTPDARLSGAMREDLPALAAKLEQSGFRTDVDRSGAWQPSAAAGGERRTTEAGAASSSQDSREHSGQDSQQRQDNPQHQNSKNPSNTPNRKADRKDFAWLLQTYR